jgi:hypothetical protein
MNYSNFEARVKNRRQKPKLTIYPQELLQTVERLHFESRVDLKAIAEELRKEPEWSTHTHAALHSAFSRHCRKVATARNLPRRASYTKPKTQRP